MERIFKQICSAYELGELQTYEPLGGGTEACVWKLTARESYLVRTLRDRAQGERELAVSAHLIKQNFCDAAVIFETGDGEPALQINGVWYQVQEFCPGPMPDPGVAGVAARIARAVRGLAAHMPEGLIHGDLGLWNMSVRPDGSIRIIDFGSVREGDPFFDYATAFAGIINHTTDEARAAACRAFLAELAPDRERLLLQLRLWAEEGTARWGERDEAMAKRFYRALNWAEEHIYEL